MDLLFDFWHTIESTFQLATSSLTDISGSEELIKSLKGIEQQADDIGKAAKSSAKSIQQDKVAGFLGMPIYDKDVIKLIFRFALNMFAVTLIGRYIYYPISKRKDYLFTYIMISLITFFICFTLKKFDLGLGMALGLFAIFGIIRYRTDPIPIKEMTYLFIIIGISVINALANKKMSYVELGFTNLVTIIVTYCLERVWLLKHEAYKSIVYEKIALIKASEYDALKNDLEDRTGLNINRVEVGKIDFLRDTANVKIFYFEDEQNAPQFEERD